MCSLSIMELKILVSIVNVKQLHKEIFADMSSLSIIELNIIVNIVNIKQVQVQKAAFANMYSLSITVINIVVFIGTLKGDLHKHVNCEVCSLTKGFCGFHLSNSAFYCVF